MSHLYSEGCKQLMCFFIICNSMEAKRRYKKLKQKQELKRNIRADTRHFSAATEIKAVVTTTVFTPDKDGRQFIGSTIIEEGDENDKELQYRMEMMSVVVSSTTEM